MSKKSNLGWGKVEEISLKNVISNIRDRGGRNPEIKRRVSNAGIQIILRLNAQFGFRRKEIGPMKTHHPTPKGGKPNGQKGKEGTRWRKAARFPCLEPEGKDTENEESPENEVNLATRWINPPNALVAGNWERKNWGAECSSIIDTGFNGGRMRV